MTNWEWLSHYFHALRLQLSLELFTVHCLIVILRIHNFFWVQNLKKKLCKNDITQDNVFFQVSHQRLLSFIKRLTSLCLQLHHHGVLSVLASIRSLIQVRCSSFQQHIQQIPWWLTMILALHHDMFLFRLILEVKYCLIQSRMVVVFTSHI